MKSQLQDIQKKIQPHDTLAVKDARTTLDQAAARYNVSSNGKVREIFDVAMRNVKEMVRQSGQYNQNAAFGFQIAYDEKSTSTFLNPDTNLRRIWIERVVIPSANVSTNPHEIALHFLELWESDIGDANSSCWHRATT